MNDHATLRARVFRTLTRGNPAYSRTPYLPSPPDPPERWSMGRALAFVRGFQPAAMEAGWCLLLGGGVLNNGSSHNDLDLLAYPRTTQSRVEDLIRLLPDGVWTWAPLEDPVARVYSFQADDGPVELIFQTFGVVTEPG